MALRKYILKRLLHAVIVVYLVTTVVFFASRAIPGDPAILILGRDANQAQIQALRETLGLDQPIYVQYVRWMQQVFSGDLGTSLFTGRPVLTHIVEVAPATVSIAVVGITIALMTAIPAGIISAVRQYEIEDDIVTVVSFLGLSLPSFFTGILLMLVFAGWLEVLPSFGYSPLRDGFIDWLKHIILPSTAIGIAYGGILMRMVRSSMLDVLNEDYMRTARAKGLDDRLILFKHGLQNALIPIVTIAGILFGMMIGGVVALEIVFGIHGFGRLIIQSISRRDFPIVQGAVITISIIFVMLNLIVDILYTFIDPQIKY